MALAAGGPAPDRQPSPNRLAPLSSNNPFRNRAASPSPQPTTLSPASPRQAPPRPSSMSKNPFLDASETVRAPRKTSSPKIVGLTDDIFKDLSLLDKPNGAQPPPRYAATVSRAGTLPPPASRPSASDEHRERPPRLLRGPDSPTKREHRPRARGLSESSVIDEKERQHRRERERAERPKRTESEERRRRERRKEREERHKREKERERGGGKTRRPQGLDIIDKLDVTGVYGQGLFHHDGPFDACNPHRNKSGGKMKRPAPMQAFAADSMNMALGGSGPVRSRLDLDKIHGRGEEGFSDYASTRKQATATFNAAEAIEQVHGDSSAGLGTSTFLEGATAGRNTVQRRESEGQEAMYQQQPMYGGGGGRGITRKKSLAQRFRGMSANRKFSAGQEMRTSDTPYEEALVDSPPGYWQQKKAISAGGPARARFTRDEEVNPFDNEYDNAFDRKGAQIRIAEQERPSAGRMRSGSSHNAPGLVRSVTADSAQQVRGRAPAEDEGKIYGNSQPNNTGGGFLSRMKSMKGGKRARPERRDT